MYKVLVVPSRDPHARPLPMCEGCFDVAKGLSERLGDVAATRWHWYHAFDYAAADDAESGTACAECGEVKP